MSKVFNMVGGGGGATASIFVTGLSETDTVTATNGSKTKVGVWTQKPNPAIHGLPDGYTELECIIGGSTQYINTGFTPNQDTRVVLDHKFIGNTTNRVGFGSRVSAESRGFLYVADFNTDKTKSFVQYGGTYADAGNLYASERHIVDFNKNNFYQDDVLKKTFSYTSFTAPGPMYLFAGNYSGTTNAISDMILYRCQIYDNGEIVRDFIPAKRNSDSIVGLYDIVNGVFYENAGTGTFTAGAEVPQTIDGFLIDKIKDFGTWTVTATDGTNTATQDVLVDVITEYEIEMEFKPNYLMLYDFGDECEDVTGGWTTNGYSGGGSWGLTAATKNADNIYTAGPSENGVMTVNALGTDAGISTKGYNAVFALAKNIGTDGYYPYLFILLGGKGSIESNTSGRFITCGQTGTKWLYTNTLDALKVGDSGSVAQTWKETPNFYETTIFPAVCSEYRSTRKANWYAVFMTKADDIATLCEKAGISAPSLLTSFVADATAMNAIFGNEEAVEFMAKYCTGDFMALAIQSSAFLTAYNASPYKGIVTSNKHWAKFLAMAQ